MNEIKIRELSVLLPSYNNCCVELVAALKRQADDIVEMVGMENFRYEIITDYFEGLEWLRSKGFRVYGIVCDSLRGLFHELRIYKVQIFQFHHMMIVRRYLTNKPNLPASKALLEICYMMTHTDKEDFVRKLELWHDKWEYFLNERSTDSNTGKTAYKHKRLRSAYLSIKRNMPWLWTFQDYPKLHIPNTNNALEGVFTDIKTKLRVHPGITKNRRVALIQEYIARHY